MGMFKDYNSYKRYCVGAISKCNMAINATTKSMHHRNLGLDGLKKKIEELTKQAKNLEQTPEKYRDKEKLNRIYEILGRLKQTVSAAEAWDAQQREKEAARCEKYYEHNR